MERVLLLRRPGCLCLKRGQTLEDVARTFSLPLRALVSFNGLASDPEEGQVLFLPEGDLYEVRGGETMALLSGSERSFTAKNGTKWLYPTQRVLL
ncbi:MAG: hypothetical protein DBX60_04070 [Bacillota bacterium]|nr:MAG: hypothetical protein DBX60_04070 [Bacillota bacterium]